jgi:4-hydroxy-tetrahydrodipicolinate synthase
MVTPFDAQGGIDEEAVERLASYLVEDQRNTGLVINGTTGESPTTTPAEKAQVLRRVKATVGDRAAILFGAGTYSTAESAELVRLGEAEGADGIMLVNPYYNRPGQAGLIAHFRTLAELTALPVMLYNIAPRSAINLETDSLMQLAETPNIVAVKEASGNLGQISDVCRRRPDGFLVYSGDDALTLPILSVGGDGLVSVAAHVAGRNFRALIDQFPTQPTEARAIHHRLSPLVAALFSAPSPVPVKYAVSQAGFGRADVRLPLVPLSDPERAVVQKALDDYALNASAMAGHS